MTRRSRLDRTKQETRVGQQQRAQIARTAAALILEHGITDWHEARRKAARQWLLPENDALPDDDDIETALYEHQALFNRDTHASQLRVRRLQALVWMDRLAEFSPKLYGALAEGWGGEHQDIRLEVVADDPKTVELRLINDGIRYHPVSAARNTAEVVTLHADDGISEALIRIHTPITQRQRGKPSRPMLNRAALKALLENPRHENASGQPPPP